MIFFYFLYFEFFYFFFRNKIKELRQNKIHRMCYYNPEQKVSLVRQNKKKSSVQI